MKSFARALFAALMSPEAKQAELVIARLLVPVVLAALGVDLAR